MWTAVILGMILIFTFIIVQSIIAVGTFFDTHKLIKHQIISIKINPPFTIENKIISPIPEDKKVSKKVQTLIPQAEAKEIEKPQVRLAVLAEPAGLDDIVDSVWALESSRGQATSGHHIVCRSQGMWNELGYDNYGGTCFKDKSEGFARVKRWFTEQLQSLSLAEALCKYNTGTPSDSCQYYQSYLNIQ